MSRQIDYTVLEKEIVHVLVAADRQGVVLLEFIESDTEPERYLSKIFPEADIHSEGRFVQEAKRQLIEYFQGQRKEFTCPVVLQGTKFQKKVWEELQWIPFGQTKSYGEISTLVLGSPKGARAVGQANGRNPIAIIIPCHRVINQSGKLGGFAGGLKVKEWLLAWEKTF